MFGVDISKRTFDVAYQPPHAKPVFATFEQSDEGYQQARQWFDAHDPDGQLPVIMEHTGKLWKPLAWALHGAKRPVSVLASDVLSAHVRKMHKVRHKNDPQDALALARHGKWLASAAELRLWDFHCEDVEALQEQQRYLNSLIKRLAGAKVSLKQALNQRVKYLIGRDIDWMSRCVEELRQELSMMIQGKPEFAEDDRLIRSIPGLGEQASLVLISEIQDIRRFSSADELAAWAAVVPMHKQSGQFKGNSRIGPGGNSAIRRVLYMCAMVARTERVNNPTVRAMYLRMSCLNEKGEVVGNPELSATQIQIALAHKLLRQVYGVLTRREPFDPDYLAKRKERLGLTQKAS